MNNFLIHQSPSQTLCIVLTIVIILFGCTSESQADLVVTDGIVGYWPGEGNANDNSGNAADGTLIGDTTFAIGIDGLSFSFDGSGDAMRASAFALPTGATDRSIAFWIYSENYDVGNRFLGGWGSYNNNAMSSMILGRFDAPDRRPSFWGYFNDLESNVQLTNGQWHHLAFTIKDSFGRLYIDGQQDASGSMSGLNTPAGTQFRLADTIGVMNNFAGQLDEIAVYNRALDSQEVAMLAGVPEPTSCLVFGLTAVGILLRRRRALD